MRNKMSIHMRTLYLDGKKDEACAKVPTQLIDEVCIVGSADRIRDRLQRWKDAGARKEVGSMLLAIGDVGTMEVFAKEML